MATVFSIDGPREVPYFQGKGGRTILDENVRQFWEKNAEVAESRGCYVFGIRAGKGLTPAYVGKATKTFKQEVFSHHKLTRYQQFLANYRRGTPILFFVVAPTKRGVPNVSHIEELEDFLIQTGQAANPDLLNIVGTKEAEWGIAGVLRGGVGKPTHAAREFRRLMSLNLPSEPPRRAEPSVVVPAAKEQQNGLLTKLISKVRRKRQPKVQAGSIPRIVETPLLEAPKVEVPSLQEDSTESQNAA